ncbi:probable E3 ubiquitin-protein ligase RNF217 [Rhinatrema bivittatum]|uniref:probable E3 ubiquitin-protein ligase RNF217 n=1 Tax=Rhinatrema bivittatum TaxID=194408 RepID=UPI00112A9408|nr:probable E3 ubiquitin-protein ligase RNF217 [Rhinatrema bivittatum]XP_029472494.1 probable E3 ubiquitin-protein ligase RNF217 [Rhinatrema bivittatum]
MSDATENLVDIYTDEETKEPNQSPDVKELKKQMENLIKLSGMTESKTIQSPSTSKQILGTNKTDKTPESVFQQNRNKLKQKLEAIYGPDGITGDDFEACPKILMSCGHAVDPKSLNDYCKYKIESEDFRFTCPTVTEDGSCNKEWSYEEIRRNAFLSTKQKEMFEEVIALKTLEKSFEIKQCPRCYSYVERSNPTNLSVKCIVCSADGGTEYFFCWQCLQEWKGPFDLADKCENKNCRNQDLEILQKCPLIALLETEIKNCPSIRACPTCGKLVSHNQRGCKNVTCNGCHKEFCFACLELTPVCQANKPGSWFELCAKPIAPRQSSIPKWSHNK